MQALEQAILETAAGWEHEGRAEGAARPIIGAVDETFLERMMLVCMDLASGYLLMEEVAVDRTYDTWGGLVQSLLKTLGVEVSYLVSDRAKALLKPSRQCQAQQGQALVEVREAEVQRWQAVRNAYRTHLANLSLSMHPWRLLDSTRQTSNEVARQLHAEIAALATLIETNGLPVKESTLDKVRKQRTGVSALIDLWWQTVWRDVVTNGPEREVETMG